MAYNKQLHQIDLDMITKQLIQEAIFLAYRDGIKSVAPLGFSGDDILLFGSTEPKRKSVVSLRNYSGDAELLITDTVGNFIFYGRFDVNLGVDFLAEQYWNIFQLTKSKIETELPNVSEFKEIKTNENTRFSEGFDMIWAYQESKLRVGEKV